MPGRRAHVVIYTLAIAVIVAAVLAGGSPWILVIAAEFAFFLFDELVTGPRRQERARLSSTHGFEDE